MLCCGTPALNSSGIFPKPGIKGHAFLMWETPPLRKHLKLKLLFNSKYSLKEVHNQVSRTFYLKTCFSSASSFSFICRSSSNRSMIIAYDSLTFFFHSSNNKNPLIHKLLKTYKNQNSSHNVPGTKAPDLEHPLQHTASHTLLLKCERLKYYSYEIVLTATNTDTQTLIL